MMISKFQSITLILLLLFVFSGCFKENSFNKGDGYEILKSSGGTIIKVETQIDGAELVLKGNVGENIIHTPDSLLRIVKYSNNNTILSIAGNIKNGSTLVQFYENVEVEQIRTLSIGTADSIRKRANETLLGDFDSSGVVDLNDFILFAKSYGTFKSQFDIAPAAFGTGVWQNIYCSSTPDNVVDLQDFILFARNYGKIVPVQIENPVKNPGFESGTSNWSAASIFTVDSTEKHTGNSSIKLTGTGSWNNLSQGQIPCKSNSDYTIGFWAKSSSIAKLRLFGSGWSEKISEVDTVANNVWTKYFLSFNSGNYTEIMVNFTDISNGITFFDDIEVIPKIQGVLSNISVTKQPTKLNYNVGDTSIDLNGLVVTGTYSDGSTKTEAITTGAIIGFNTTTIGSKTLTVLFEGKSTTFTINVFAYVPLLNTLLINNGSINLNPAFDPQVVSYSSTVKNVVSTISLTATFDSAKVTVTGTGDKILTEGQNLFNITAKAADGTTKIYTLSITRLPKSSSTAMQIGTNFHNIMWSGPANYYKSTPIDWTTEINPWNPAFLKDLEPFTGPLRFMDFDCTNTNPIIHWSDRAKKTDDHWKLASYIAAGAYKKMPVDASIQAYFPGASTKDYYGVAYEWMIDLCNVTGRDMWICVPSFADDDYCKQLATLINSTLNPGLKCYVEYSNETWNGGFDVFQYTIDKGIALALPDQPGNKLTPPPGVPNKWYQGGAFSVLRSLQIFKIFQDVFGASNTGLDKRLVRVLSASGNGHIAELAVQNIIFDGSIATDYTNIPYNTKYNPFNQKPDLFATAPYVGSGLDGASLNIASLFRAVTEKVYVNGVSNYVDIMSGKYHFPVGTYEGGQHLLNNADIWSRNPAIYDEYYYMLNRWQNSGLKIFMQYTLYSNFNSGGAWGAKESVNKTTEESPKYRALVDWLKVNP